MQNASCVLGRDDMANFPGTWTWLGVHRKFWKAFQNSHQVEIFYYLVNFVRSGHCHLGTALYGL